jgi:hypothetical protein
MKTSFSLLLVSFLAVCCVAQQTPSDRCNIILAGDLASTVVERLQSQLNSENAQMYASLFDSAATWDGPIGQNAIGPENIKRAAYLMFRTVGPLQCLLWVQRKVSADTWIVDMYQKAKEHSRCFAKRHFNCAWFGAYSRGLRYSHHARLTWKEHKLEGSCGAGRRSQTF